MLTPECASGYMRASRSSRMCWRWLVSDWVFISRFTQCHKSVPPSYIHFSKADSNCFQLTASNGHPIIGIIVIGALVFQPIGGLIHHYMYKKYQRRTLWSTTHVWWGRIILTLGIINGGLGLMLSGNTVKVEIAYGVVAGVMWLIWVIFAVWGHLNKSRGTMGETGEKALGHSDASSSLDRKNDQYRDA